MFPHSLVMLASFHLLIAYLGVFFGETSTQVLCPFFSQDVCFAVVELWEFCIYSGCEPFLRHLVSKCLLHFSGCVFTPLSVPLISRVLHFDVVPFMVLLLLLVFLVSYPRNYCHIQCHKSFPFCFLLAILSFDHICRGLFLRSGFYCIGLFIYLYARSTQLRLSS